MSNVDHQKLRDLSQLMRYWILKSTHRAGSGHPTSALSAVELMAGLFFGGVYRYDTERPDHPNNDRVIFSKGHASPLLYALWAAAGKVTEKELMTYRRFESVLEGHPTSRFAYAEAATGSLGQGLSIGVGMALAAKQESLDYRTFVLLGDSEMAEGSQWEAIQLAAHYGLGNLIGILDVNRLGQRGETMFGHDLVAYQRRIDAFGWQTVLVEDGHDFAQVLPAYESATEIDDRPVMIVARTIKGNGVKQLEDQNGWHGKALDDEQLETAVKELGQFDHRARGKIVRPPDASPAMRESSIAGQLAYDASEAVATRTAYGNALCRLAPQFPHLVALDGEVCNSTRSKRFRDAYPDRFFEMFIAEQNMVGTALGLSLRGKLPFVSTFAAFLMRAFDQIRMTPHSDANIKFVGSHAGVSIGQDGPSQMGLEDIAMFRTIPGAVVLYPSDAIATERLVEVMAKHRGIAYLRTTRVGTPILYDANEPFQIGGSKVLLESDDDEVAVVTAGITLHAAMEAADALRNDGVPVRVIDLYSIKPIDEMTLRSAADATGRIITVEDHYPEGGLGEAVRTALSNVPCRIVSLAVGKRPMSGQPDELLEYEGISAAAIEAEIRRMLAAVPRGASNLRRREAVKP